jgi:CheY-like chemotaxis protein/anti-sigma regulatory factor (Ser/Thr protein kinase)
MPAMSQSAQPENSPTILVVDDETAVRQMLQHILENAGYRTASAGNGREALEALEHQSYDLVLLDVWMPEMNGMELLGELRSRWMLPKVIVMSADGAPQTVLTAVKEQAYHYITKPVPPDELLALVADVLQASPAVPSIEVVSAEPRWVELLVPCDKPMADRIQGFLDKLDTQIPADVRKSVGLAFRELLLNAIEWGGGLDPRKKVRIAYLRLKKLVLYRIADPGTGFKLDSLEHSALANPEEDPTRHALIREERGIRPGGFGILLAQSMVDELLYNEARNEVLLVKYLD